MPEQLNGHLDGINWSTDKGSEIDYAFTIRRNYRAISTRQAHEKGTFLLKTPRPKENPEEFEQFFIRLLSMQVLIWEGPLDSYVSDLIIGDVCLVWNRIKRALMWGHITKDDETVITDPEEFLTKVVGQYYYERCFPKNYT